MTASPARRAIVFEQAASSWSPVVRMCAGAALLIAAGVLLGFAVDAMSPLPVEQRALTALAEDRSPATTTFFVVVTRLGDLWFVALATAILTPLLHRMTGGWHAAALLWAALLGSLLVTTVVKVVVGRARPVDALMEVSSGAFPSGHTSRAAAVLGLCIWAVVALSSHPGVRAAGATVLSAGIVVMGLSRLYLGVHWPSDVIFGFVLGVSWLIVMLKALRPRPVTTAEAEHGSMHPPREV